MQKSTNRSLLILLFSFFIFLFSFSSCKTIHPITDEAFDETGFLPLDRGAFAYIVIDVPKARPILNNTNFVNMNDKQVKQILDKTRTAAAAVYVPWAAQGSLADRLAHRHYQLVAWGKYPASGAKAALGANKNWEKFPSETGVEYWYSSESNLSIAMTKKKIALLATYRNVPDASNDPLSDAEGITIPEGFSAFRQGSIISCWLEKPGSVINQRLGSMGIPIEIPAEQFFIRIVPAPEPENYRGKPRYEAIVRIQVPSAVQARALTTIFTYVRGTFSANGNSGSAGALAAILFANPPVQDGKYLTITTSALNTGEIALLFAMF